MNKIITAGILLFGIAIFTSCNKDCPEQNVDDLNAIYLDFKTSGSDAFTPEMLQSVFMVRYLTDTLDTLSFQADTFLYYQEGFYADDFKIRISKDIPRFDESGAPYYTAYNYSIQNINHDFEVLITGIDMKGGYDDENCEYTNSTKKFLLDGDSVDVTGSQEYVLIRN